MFRHMSHTCKSLGTIQEYHAKSITLYNNKKVQNVTLNFYGTQIIRCLFCNYDYDKIEEKLENLIKKKYNGEIITQSEIIEMDNYLLPKSLSTNSNPMSDSKIYFSPNKIFATYKYTYHNINLEEENTFIFCGVNKLLPIEIELVAEKKGNKKNKFDRYECKIIDYLLTK